MNRIAIILFPGTNCETETMRSLRNAGLAPEYVRWNERERVGQFDGYVLPGGFAYEDRGRAGIIAAQDPIMKLIKAEAEKGKPVIGICNGCQVLVETGLVPGLDNTALAGAVAMNTRVKSSRIIGTGFYHDTIYIKSVVPQGRSCVTMTIPEQTVIPATVANGEGRFIFPTELLLELEQHNQILFKYCTAEGIVLNEFPTTPNGATWGIAGMCNRAGNVVAYMPHPERFDTGVPLFNSLRDYLSAPSTVQPYPINWQPKPDTVEQYHVPDNVTQVFVDLKITDNAAKTVELTLQHEGYTVTVKRKTHWEIWHKPVKDQTAFLQKLLQTGELLNTNKESFATEYHVPTDAVTFLTRYSDDYEGKAVATTLHDRFEITPVENIRKGVLWELYIPEPDATKRNAIASSILQTHILYNPYAQECKVLI